MSRPLLYVCAPFRTRTQAEAEQTDHALRLATLRGWAPIFAPYIFRGIFSDEKPEERAVMLDVDASIIQACDAFLVLGERATEGMKKDIAVWNAKKAHAWPAFDSIGPHSDPRGKWPLPDLNP